MGVGGIIEGIDAAMGNRHKGRRWVSKFVMSSMSFDALEYAVKNNSDPWAAVVQKYHLDDPRIAPLARLLLRVYWNGRGGIEESLTDVRKVYNRLARNSANREILRRPETVRWLNNAVIWAYDQVYRFTWGS